VELINRQSLAETLDAIDEALFFGRPLPKPQRAEAARWIASRQGLPGSYCGMFAPTARDFRKGIRLFTGERFATRAGSAHVLGEEACRALILLGAPGKEVRRALAAAGAGIAARLAGSEQREASAGRPFLGKYCCGKCSVALWRHLAAGGLKAVRPRSWLAAGVKGLKASRDGRGRWKGYPFHYTLLALSEMPLPAAAAEMRYAAPALERALRRAARDGKYARRRRALAERILARC
jgi:hypothetical protein